MDLNILNKIDEIDYRIREFEVDSNIAIREDEYYDFMYVEHFKELFKDEPILDTLKFDTTFVVFEEGESPVIYKQYNLNAIDSYCQYLEDYRYDILTEEDVETIRQELVNSL